MNRKRIVAHSLITGLSVAVILGCTFSASTASPTSHTAPSTSTPIIFMVDAREGWQAITTVLADDRVTIRYVSNQWSYWPEGAGFHDAAGSGYTCCHEECVEPLPCEPSGALIARLNDEIFSIGNDTTFTAEHTGSLSLRINDPDDALYDNEGHVKVEVIINHT